MSQRVALSSWNLLKRLPLSPHIYEKLLKLDDIKNNILDNSCDYKLLYSLYIIEYLMEDQNKKNEIYKKLFENAELEELKKKWKTEFIIQGGFEHLWNIFIDIQSNFNSKLFKLDINKKIIYSSLFKIFKYYLTACFSSSNEKISNYTQVN